MNAIPKITPERLAAAETINPGDTLPQPQPLVRAIPKGQRFPVEALGPLRAAVDVVQAITQAPVAIPAQSALAVAALAVQGFADVETLGGDRPLSLYALTIAVSGERKSSCDGPLMHGVREFEREQSQAHNDARKAWKVDCATWKARADKVLAMIKQGKAERRDLAALGPEPAPPPIPDRVVSEPTYEGLTRLFVEGQPSLGLFSDEGGQFLGGFAMSADNRQKTLAALNSLWMGDPIKRTRQGDGAYTLYGRRLSLHLMVQPVVAYGLMADPLAGDTGFLPRCLICEPESTIGTRLHRNEARDTQPLDDFRDRLGDVLATAMPMDPETRALRPRCLALSAEARAQLIAFSDTVERAQRPGGEMEAVRGYASKAAEQAARIAGVLALWRDLAVEVIGGRDMENGIALARFYLLEAQRLAGAAMVSDAVAKAEALCEWLRSPSWSHPHVTLRDVVQRGPNRLRESPEAKKAIALLVEHGWLVPLAPMTEIDGRLCKEAWRIVRE